MSATASHPVGDDTSAMTGSSWRFWLQIVLAALVLSSAIGSGSLWIDEGFSAWLACHRTLPSMLDSLRAGDSSDLGMLLHNIYLWAWVHLFGSSEYTLRAANTPFILLLAAALAFTSRLALGHRRAWIALIVAPFLWIFANEARAYFPMLACAAASTGAMLIYAYGDPAYRSRATWLCPIFFLAAISFHMLACFLLPAFAVIVIAEVRHNFRRWYFDWRLPLIALSPLFLVTAAYYAWILSRGEAYVYGTPSLRHLLSVLFDFAGLQGLGPNRSVLRQNVGLQVMFPYIVPLAAGVAALVFALASRWDHRAKVITTAWVVGLTAASVAGFAMNSLFLARHVSAMVPLLLFSLVTIAKPYRLGLLAAVWLVSDARITLLPEYAKDDYRAAVQYVIGHSPGVTLWAGDQLTAAYYGLKVDNPYHLRYYEVDYFTGLDLVNWPVRATGTTAANLDPPQVEQLIAQAHRRKQPILLAMSKSDLYDVHGGWAPILLGLKPIARFQSFDIFQIH